MLCREPNTILLSVTRLLGVILELGLASLGTFTPAFTTLSVNEYYLDLWTSSVGKSAFMQTLDEAEASQGVIFTTLFLSRPNERDDPKKVSLLWNLGLPYSTLITGVILRRG